MWCTFTPSTKYSSRKCNHIFDDASLHPFMTNIWIIHTWHEKFFPWHRFIPYYSCYILFLLFTWKDCSLLSSEYMTQFLEPSMWWVEKYICHLIQAVIMFCLVAPTGESFVSANLLPPYKISKLFHSNSSWEYELLHFLENHTKLFIVGLNFNKTSQYSLW